MKNKIVVLLFIIPIFLFSCVAIHKLYDTPLGFYEIMILNSFRLKNFENNCACFYNKYGKFPGSEDSIEILDKDSVFRKIQHQYFTDELDGYCFEIQPYTFRSNKDSIKIYHFVGNIIFDSSLISQNIDSLIVIFEFVDLTATIYEKNDSTFYNKETAQIFYRSSGPLEYKIPLKNSCNE